MKALSPEHQTYAHVKWRNAVRAACSNKCYITGESGDVVALEAHHIKRSKTHPDLRHELSNGLMLRADLHRYFHLYFCGGYDEECDMEMLDFFKILYHKIKE